MKFLPGLLLLFFLQANAQKPGGTWFAEGGTTALSTGSRTPFYLRANQFGTVPLTLQSGLFFSRRHVPVIPFAATGSLGGNGRCVACDNGQLYEKRTRRFYCLAENGARVTTPASSYRHARKNHLSPVRKSLKLHSRNPSRYPSGSATLNSFP